MASDKIDITPVSGKGDLTAFIELAYRLNADDPNWVPPLKDEVYGLITPGKNPWFEHGEAQLFLAERGGQVVGRITAHIDQLALAQPPEQGMGPGVGFWGFLEAEDEEAAKALLDAAIARTTASLSMTPKRAMFSATVPSSSSTLCGM